MARQPPEGVFFERWEGDLEALLRWAYQDWSFTGDEGHIRVYEDHEGRWTGSWAQVGGYAFTVREGEYLKSEPYGGRSRVVVCTYAWYAERAPKAPSGSRKAREGRLAKERAKDWMRRI